MNNALFDWLAFCDVSASDPDSVITDFLELDTEIFAEQGYGANGYRNCKVYGGIRVYYNGRKGTETEFGGGTEFMGVYVALSGTGCRQYELLGGDLFNLLARWYDNRDVINLTRLDNVGDDLDGILDMQTLLDCKRNKQIRSRSRKRRIVESEDGDVKAAYSLYIGSSKSDMFFRIYDKAKEHYDAYKEPENYNSHWIRVEHVLKHDTAEHAGKYIVESVRGGKSIGECIAEIINGHLQFIELDDSNISRCSVAPWWTEFLDTISAVKVSGSTDVKHIFERKLEWFYESLAPLTATLVRGVGVHSFLGMLYTALKRQNKKQSAMLKAFQSDVIPKGVGEILGSDFRREHFRDMAAHYPYLRKLGDVAYSDDGYYDANVPELFECFGYTPFDAVITSETQLAFC